MTDEAEPVKEEVTDEQTEPAKEEATTATSKDETAEAPVKGEEEAVTTTTAAPKKDDPSDDNEKQPSPSEQAAADDGKDEEKATKEEKPQPAADEETEKPKAAAAVLTIAGVDFDTPYAAREHVKKLIESTKTKEGEYLTLSGEAEKFVSALLRHHPNADEKIGGVGKAGEEAGSNGPKAIKYGPNKDFPETKCFYAVHEDGSEHTFSFQKCIETAFEKVKPGSVKRKHWANEGDDVEENKAKQQKVEPEFVPGVVVVADGIEQTGNFRELKEYFGKYGKVKYVEFLREEGSSNKVLLRFADATEASAAAEAAKTEFDGKEVTMTLLEGEDEKKYWERLQKSREERAARGGNHGKFVPGEVVVATNVEQSADFRELKEFFGYYGFVKFVELRDGKAYIRFKDAAGASAAVKDGETEYGGVTVSMTLLEGDEGQRYWDRLHERRGRYNGGGRGGRGRGRGGRGRGRGGRGRGGRGRGRGRRY